MLGAGLTEEIMVRAALMGLAFSVAIAQATYICADGKIVPPRDYEGSLEEKAQEAIIVFQGSKKPGEAIEDLILKVTVAGEVDKFAWVIPFPTKPEVKKESAELFKELFNYVEARLQARQPAAGRDHAKSEAPKAAAADKPVEVLERKVVGNYDVATVKENKSGALAEWLTAEGFQALDGPGDVQIIEWYRKKGYLFVCVKVSDTALAERKEVELHPLRFRFKTGGQDGIYFPMKMTAMQYQPFNINLYVFHRYWLNNELNRYGYVHRGFELKYRDWDSPKCVANGGKTYSAPETDPLLADLAAKIPTVKKYFQKLYPGQTFYLTNLQAQEVEPADLRDWADDLWLFPFYTDKRFVPYDARPGGVAAAAWSRAAEDDEESREDTSTDAVPIGSNEDDASVNVMYENTFPLKATLLGILIVALGGAAMWLVHVLRPGRG
jgi:hypothetical protein